MMNIKFKRIHFLGAVLGLALGLAGPAHAEEEGGSKGSGESRAREKSGDKMSLPAAYNDLSAREQAADRRLSTAPGAPTWQSQGPYGIGRVACMAVHPTNDKIIFVGAGGGGVWKTSDGGITFKQVLPITAKSQHIGDVQISKADPKIVWIGTGEPNAGGGGYTYPGDGIYKSTDGGETFKHMGLEKSFVIGRIAIHPTDPNIVLVAVQGSFLQPHAERGIYRTTDGGATWTKTLFVDNSTGAVDVHYNPSKPNVVFANTWYAMRQPYARQWTGPTCRIHRSDDGGVTWRILGAAEGLPTADIGKSTMAVCATNPNIMYIFYLAGNNNFKAIYRSANGGDAWAQTASGPPTSAYSYYAHYFTQIRANPHNCDDIVTGGISGYRSSNGGVSWSQCFLNTHTDQHAFEWSYQNPNVFYLGDDGGFATSNGPNGTFTYQGKSATGGLEMAQIYSLDIVDNNYRYAGLQDNNTMMTTNGTNWAAIIPGDGMFVKVDYGANANVIGCLQDGNCQRSGARGSGMQGIGGIDLSAVRGPWDTNGDIDPTNGNAYLGYEFVFRAARGSNNFVKISPDLTNGNHSVSNYGYGTVSDIAAYACKIWAGTDDGNVWISKDQTNWIKIRNGNGTGPGEGEKKFDGWVKDVSIDLSDVTGATAFVAVSYFRWGHDYWKPAMFRVTNFGATAEDWHDITGDMPKYISVNDIIRDRDPARSKNIYAGTEYGVYVSTNEGVNWNWLGDAAMPIHTINDIVSNGNFLYAATYGRGIWRVDVSQGVVGAKEPIAKASQFLKNFPNPVMLSTQVQFRVKNDQKLQVSIFDLQGRVVKTLMDKQVSADKLYSVTWNRTDNRGSKVKAGNYILRAFGDRATLARQIEVR